MADVRATSTVPVTANFCGPETPTISAPVIVDTSTGNIYTLKTGDVVKLAGVVSGVVGPSSSTDGDVVLFNGTTGLVIKDSGKAFTPAGIGSPSGSGTSTGTNTGDQTITLTGPITGSGTGTFGTSVASQTGTGSQFAMAAVPSFGTTIGVGAATASASGAGITFPATQSASTNANTLDDYQDAKAWTPTDQSGASLSFTVTADGCIAYKIASMVYCYFDFTFPATASGANILIGGLPYTAKNTTHNIAFGVILQNASGSPLFSLVNTNATTFSFTNQGGAVQLNSLFSGALARGCLIYPATQ